ncbi:MAG: hypothetical protein GC153_08170 [Alphaproteobacteria bacterium]|nr:hypothetical protein [Alphaproteobacteria bacterium]
MWNQPPKVGETRQSRAHAEPAPAQKSLLPPHAPWTRGARRGLRGEAGRGACDYWRQAAEFKVSSPGTPMPNPITTSVTETLRAPLADAFAAASGCDIPSIFQAHGRIPGVIKVDEHHGPWGAVGEKRLLTLSDGSTVREELVSFAPNEEYSYRVSGFTGPFAALVSEGRGVWHFTIEGPATTRIDWTYSFTPKSFLTEPAVWFIVKALWPGYMRKALARLKSQTEKAANAS